MTDTPLGPPELDILQHETPQSTMNIDIAGYSSRLPLANKVRRLVWNVVWLLFFRSSPRPLFGWRRWVLRCFGARIGTKASIYPTTKIWGPWHLEMGDYSCLGPDVDCYCMAPIRIGHNATVSQYAYLCTGTHDISDPHMKLVAYPINIGDGAWVCAGVFVGPGVTLGEGAVAGARSSVFKDVEPWAVVGGNPAKFIKKRVLRTSQDGD
jgi:putative colanic acid biosynthesis acetyltransferase WcaF